MNEREKHASKETRSAPFSALPGTGAPNAGGMIGGGGGSQQKKHRGIVGSLLHRDRSASQSFPHHESIIPPQGGAVAPILAPAPLPGPPPPPSMPPAVKVHGPPPPPPAQPPAGALPGPKPQSSLDTVDPSWKHLLDELLEMGITEDEIKQNSEFIKDYIEQKQLAEGELAGAAPAPAPASAPASAPAAPPAPPPPPPPGAAPSPTNKARSAAPPPPPSAAPSSKSISPQHTGASVSSGGGGDGGGGGGGGKR
ncbi:hypothetical protein KEM54_004401, partial [Ascosphaera aggregata]